ncbi:MAG TPA: glycosyltransferase family 39 protein [Gaiellaceae bacterium]|nr:glycosyltransferase family 39 protein [Gaiellaceae bacterium]
MATVPWGAAVLAVAVIAASMWYLAGRALTLPQVFSDELIYMEAARTLAEHGAVQGHYGIAVPAFDAIAYLLAPNQIGAYHLIQLMNSAAMASAAFPAYLLARRALPRSWALAVSALTVSVPWMVYARFVMTEAVFYPVFLWFVLALVRALERPTRRRQLILLLVGALAFAVRAQAAVLFPAIGLAVLLYGAAQGSVRAAVKSFAFTWLVACAGGVLAIAAATSGAWHPFGAYGVLLRGWWHPHGLLLWAAANVTSLSLGVGILVAAASPLGAAALLRRGNTASEQALAAAAVSSTLALLVTVVVLSESTYGLGTVHERNLFYVVPLLLICALAWAARAFPASRRMLAATLAASIGLALLMPAGTLEGSSFDALSLKYWTRLGPGWLAPHTMIVVAVTVGAIVLVVARSTTLLIATFVLATVGVASASDYHTDVPRSQTANYQWVDRALPAHAHATLLWIDCSAPSCPAAHPAASVGPMSVYTELFNSRITNVGHIGTDNPSRGLATEAFNLGADGTVLRGGTAIRSRYVVVDSRIAIKGVRVSLLKSTDVGEGSAGGHAALALWRTNGVVRLRSAG